MARPIAPDTPPDAALRQIVAECRADLEKYRAIVLQSRRPIGIHQTRVALRRLRAALSLFRGAVVGPTEASMVRALGAEAKWLAGECALSRDLHVFLTETVSEVPPVVKRVAGRLAKVHLERARTALSGARYNAFIGQLSSFGQPTTASSPSRLDDFGRAVLDKRHGKVEQRGHKIASLDGKRLHRLRIAIKKLRYAATFLQPAFASAASKAYIEATVRLQGALGALNDREVAGQIMVDIGVAARPTEDVEKPLRKLAKQAAAGDKHRRRRLQRAWKMFRKAEPFWRAA